MKVLPVLKIFKTLRGRLVLLVCFATLPTILFIFYVSHKERNSVLTRMTEDARHLANLALREHTHQIEVARDLLLRIADMLTQKDKYSLLLEEPDFLPTLLKGYSQLANVGILSKDGDVLRSAYPLTQFPNMRDNPAFKRASVSKKVEIGNYIIGPIVKKPILNLAYALRDENDVVRMVVFNALDLEWLNSLAQHVNLPDEYLIFIVDREGRILAQAGTTTEIPGTLAPMRIPDFAQLRDSPSGNILQITQESSRRFFVASAVSHVPDISVAVSLPYEKIASEANKTFYRILGGLSLLTLFTIISVLVAAELTLLRIIRNFSHAARRVGKGNFHIRVPVPTGHGELSELASEFNSMAASLTERHTQLREAHDRLRTLSRRLQMAREQEARRIARELHDEIGQILTMIKINLTTLQRECQKCNQHVSSQDSCVENIILEIKKAIDDAIGFVRRISSELRPSVLDRLGLSAALEWLARELQTHSSIQVELETKNMDEPIEEDISTALFRITQEALTNVVRHANATKILVNLTATPDEFLLSIRDNGKGIDPHAIHGMDTSGIIGMRERASLVNGRFQCTGKPDQGTDITVIIPKKHPHRSAYANTTC